MIKLPPRDTPALRLARELLPSLLGKGGRSRHQPHDNESYCHGAIHVIGFAPACRQRWSRELAVRSLSGSGASLVMTRITILGVHC
jgi:hypothetical protein